MTNPAKIIIALLALAVLVFAVFAFDVPYRDGNGDGNGNGGDVSDMIRVFTPQPNAVISSPAAFTGEARGGWFFEATFPIDVIALDGTVLGRGYAEALGEWMTEDFVPWNASVSFDSGNRTEGIVRFMKDNPSGLTENDAHIDVPVRFAVGTSTGTTTGPITKQCKPSGCSGQVCSDEDVVTTCEFRPEYACYRNAECKRQSDGQCGWTQTTALLACLNNPPQE